MNEKNVGDGPVVVAVDGSSASEAALVWASAQALEADRQLRVVLVESETHVQFMVPLDPVWPASAVAQAPDAQQVANSTERLVSLVSGTLGDSVDFEACVRSGDPAAELLDEALERNASLLVLGRRGFGGFKSLLLGSVSDQCAGHATCPVAVIPREATPGNGPVIVGVDGSAPSSEALRWAADYASGHSKSLHLVTCWQSVPAGPEYLAISEDVKVNAQQVVEASEAEVRSYAPGLEVRGSALEGSPGRLLNEVAAEDGAELIVVGSRGRGGFENLVLGSVAHQTLHHSTTPVVVV